MAKEVRWSDEAKEGFDKVIKYLEENWSGKEVENFIAATDRVVMIISTHPYIFRRYNKKNVREALITKHNLLIYKILRDHIDIVNLWDTRSNPKKKAK